MHRLAFVAQHPEDALLVTTEAFTQRYRVQILDFASSNKLPAMFEDSSWVEAGGLMSYGPDYQEHFRGQPPVWSDKILKGAKPADLPISGRRVGLIINLKTAKALSIAVPQSLLFAADEVIE